eukprot:5720451-Amphidinium_carterae.1
MVCRQRKEVHHFKTKPAFSLNPIKFASFLVLRCTNSMSLADSVSDSISKGMRLERAGPI